ncbi:MAG: hypothetical protein SH809_03165 [Rhodothermales bacterium]|nr:hypothetical protein [Rhodothermales bacterium]
MTTQTNNVMGQLKDKLLSASQDDIKRLVNEAQTEALEEAKSLLKERMLEAILKDAISKVNRLNPEPSVLIVDEHSEN